MRTILRLATLAVVVIAVLLVAATAQASVTVGQTGDSAFDCGGNGYTLVQDAVASDPTYTVPGGGGVLTSWSHLANADTTTSLRLKVYRRTADPTMFTTTAESSASPTLTPSTLNTFSSQIPVQGGEILGLSVLSGDAPACVFGAGAVDDRVRQGVGDPDVNTIEDFSAGGAALRINVSAVLEPDADHDTFGDETQDQCSTNAATQGSCPVTPAKKKTCKKKKHKRYAESAKKKCKKKKR